MSTDWRLEEPCFTFVSLEDNDIRTFIHEFASPKGCPGTWISPTSKLCLHVDQHLLQLWDAEKSDAEMLVLLAWEHL